MVGVTFEIRSTAEVDTIAAMLPPHVVLPQYKLPNGQILYAHVDFGAQLKKSGSPLAFLQDLLYSTSELPEGAVPHLLSAPPQLQKPLQQLLGEYRDVFPPELPK